MGRGQRSFNSRRGAALAGSWSTVIVGKVYRDGLGAGPLNHHRDRVEIRVEIDQGTKGYGIGDRHGFEPLLMACRCKSGHLGGHRRIRDPGVTGSVEDRDENMMFVGCLRRAMMYRLFAQVTRTFNQLGRNNTEVKYQSTGLRGLANRTSFG